MFSKNWQKLFKSCQTKHTLSALNYVFDDKKSISIVKKPVFFNKPETSTNSQCKRTSKRTNHEQMN